MSGSVGLSRLKKPKPEAAGSSGAVPALRMENDAPAVGRDAPTANSTGHCGRGLQSASSGLRVQTGAISGRSTGTEQRRRRTRLMLNRDEQVRLRGGTCHRRHQGGVAIGQARRNLDVELNEPGTADAGEIDMRRLAADRDLHRV